MTQPGGGTKESAGEDLCDLVSSRYFRTIAAPIALERYYGRGVSMRQIEIDMDKVTPQGAPCEGGFIKEIQQNATCKVWVRVCTIARWELEHDRQPTNEEYDAIRNEWLYVDPTQKGYDEYVGNVISFLPETGVRPCPIHASPAIGRFPEQPGHPVSAWVNDALFGGFVCAFKIEGEPELVLAASASSPSK